VKIQILIDMTGDCEAHSVNPIWFECF